MVEITSVYISFLWQEHTESACRSFPLAEVFLNGNMDVWISLILCFVPYSIDNKSYSTIWEHCSIGIEKSNVYIFVRKLSVETFSSVLRKIKTGFSLMQIVCFSKALLSRFSSYHMHFIFNSRYILILAGTEYSLSFNGYRGWVRLIRNIQFPSIRSSVCVCVCWCVLFSSIEYRVDSMDLHLFLSAVDVWMKSDRECEYKFEAARWSQ